MSVTPDWVFHFAMLIVNFKLRKRNFSKRNWESIIAIEDMMMTRYAYSISNLIYQLITTENSDGRTGTAPARMDAGRLWSTTLHISLH